MKGTLRVLVLGILVLSSNSLYAAGKSGSVAQGRSENASANENSPSHSATEIGVVQRRSAITAFGVDLIKTNLKSVERGDLVLRGGVSSLSKDASAGVEVILHW